MREAQPLLRSSDWIESYISALQSTGLSAEYSPSAEHAVDARPSASASKPLTTRSIDRSDSSSTSDSTPKDDTSTNVRVARFYVGQTLKMAEHDDAALHHAWRKAQVSGDLRGAHMAWRMWFMRMRRTSFFPQHLPSAQSYDTSDLDEEDADIFDRGANTQELSSDTMEHEDSSSATGSADTEAIYSPDSYVGLYIVLISMHGLVRGQNMELGRDPDTGGQVKYVVEYARALAAQPSVHRVDLLTRRTTDPEVDASYGEEVEKLSQPSDGYHANDARGGAHIVRLDAGPTEQYLGKEQLWPYVREFADRAIEHVRNALDKVAFAGRPCQLHLVHGHYAEAGEIASLIGGVLNAPVCFTGHSLGRNKLHHLMEAKNMTEAEVDTKYRIIRRIEAEERALDAAEMVVTSTRQEVDGQWGLYDGWDQRLANALAKDPSIKGRYMPRMHVNPPGLDFASAAGSTKGEDSSSFGYELSRNRSESDIHGSVSYSEQVKPSIWTSIERFLDNPRKPAILALARPEAKKNLTAVIKAFGESDSLRSIANVVLIMGNRDDISDLAPGSQEVIKEVLTTIDRYDLYGKVAIPKHHKQDDIPYIYRYASSTRGVFINPALQEPFGLTLIEACAYGCPIVATKHGGPVEIHRTLKNGFLIEPTDTTEIESALLTLLTDSNVWEQKVQNGLSNIHKYSWSAHCQRHLTTLAEAERIRKSVPEPPSEGMNSMGKTESFLHLQELADEEIEGGFGRVARVAHIPAQERISNKYAGVIAISIETLSPESGAKAARSAIDCIGSIGKAVAVGVLSLENIDKTKSTLQSGGVKANELDFIICNAGSDVFLRSGDRMQRSSEWSRKASFRWDADIVKKAIFRAADRRHCVTAPQRPQWSANEELQEILESEHPNVKPAKARFALMNEGQGEESQLIFEVKDVEQGVEPEVNNIRRSVRRKGIRCNLFHARGDNTLRASPLRASRALALRWVAGILGVGFGNHVLTICTPFAPEDDRSELLEGSQKKVILANLNGTDSDASWQEHAKTSYTDYSVVQKAADLNDVSEIIAKHAQEIETE